MVRARDSISGQMGATTSTANKIIVDGQQPESAVAPAAADNQQRESPLRKLATSQIS